MAKKRYPLPKRFNLALSEKAFTNLRKLNEEFNYGNNYLLTILLENIGEVTNRDALKDAFDRFEKEYGAPQADGTKKRK